VAPPYTTNDDCSGDTAPLSRALEESVLDASPGSPQHDRGHGNLSASGSNVHGGDGSGGGRRRGLK
jgi:hypothetical protein